MQAASKIPEDRASIHTGPGKNSTWQRRLTLLAMCIAQGMILLDVTIVNIALPSIQRELHASSSLIEAVTCGAVAAGDAPGVSSSGGRGPGGTMEVLTLTIACHEGRPPADDIFAYSCCPQPVPSRSPRPGP